MKDAFVNLYIFYYTSNSTFFSYMLTVYTFAIIRTFITTPLEVVNLRSIKFETTINDRIDFRKEEPIPRNTNYTYVPLSLPLFRFKWILSSHDVADNVIMKRPREGRFVFFFLCHWNIVD